MIIMRIEELISKIDNFIKTAKACCDQCTDDNCCVNAAAIEKLASDENCAKCEGYKKAPVGSPKQKAFCKRHCGMKKKLTGKEKANDPDSCINKGLRRWKCRCG